MPVASAVRPHMPTCLSLRLPLRLPFAGLPPHEQVAKRRTLVSQWINFFQRTHHSSVQHVSYMHGSDQPWKDPLPITQAMMDNCRMDGRAENFEGYSKQTRPLAVQRRRSYLQTICTSRRKCLHRLTLRNASTRRCVVKHCLRFHSIAGSKI